MKHDGRYIAQPIHEGERVFRCSGPGEEPVQAVALVGLLRGNLSAQIVIRLQKVASYVLSIDDALYLAICGVLADGGVPISTPFGSQMGASYTVASHGIVGVARSYQATSRAYGSVRGDGLVLRQEGKEGLRPPFNGLHGVLISF